MNRNRKQKHNSGVLIYEDNRCDIYQFGNLTIVDYRKFIRTWGWVQAKVEMGVDHEAESRIGDLVRDALMRMDRKQSSKF